MKTVVLKKIVQSLALVSFAAFGSSSFAGATWLFGDGLPTPTTECTASVSMSGCAAQSGAPAGTPSVKVSAFSTTGSASTFAATTLTGWAGGLGVQANSADVGSPQHSIDNSGFTDAILLDFGGTKVDLDSVKIGWKGDAAGNENTTTSDADISIFRYTGSGNPVTDLKTTGMTGWTLVGNYADLLENTAKLVNSTNATSSWWLISAYNSSYGTASVADQGAAGGGNGYTGLQNGNDYFKVLSVAGTVATPPPSVPEPGSLALMGAAMVGFMATRRRKAKAA